MTMSQSRWRLRRLAVIATAVMVTLLAVGACGDDDDDEAGTEVGEAPQAGAPSSSFGIALPEGAQAEPASALSGGEAYRVDSDASLVDINAFYEQQLDGKPFRDYEWCGAAGFAVDHIVRIWTKPDTPAQFIVELKDEPEEPEGVLIIVREEPNGNPTTCPPSPPTEQPFEGPG